MLGIKIVNTEAMCLGGNYSQNVAPIKFAKKLIYTFLLSCVLASNWQITSSLSQLVRELCEVLIIISGETESDCPDIRPLPSPGLK